MSQWERLLFVEYNWNEREIRQAFTRRYLMTLAIVAATSNTDPDQSPLFWVFIKSNELSPSFKIDPALRQCFSPSTSLRNFSISFINSSSLFFISLIVSLGPRSISSGWSATIHQNVDRMAFLTLPLLVFRVLLTMYCALFFKTFPTRKEDACVHWCPILDKLSWMIARKTSVFLLTYPCSYHSPSPLIWR